ncbi:MAG: helix-turn-helix transcriptional regulator [FCB group bacterium]|jgi:DNA-binding transcriptional regulator YiaG
MEKNKQKNIIKNDGPTPVISGQEFKYIRKYCRLSQKEFGEYVKRSHSFVSKLESQQEVSLYYIKRLIEYINDWELICFARKKFSEGVPLKQPPKKREYVVIGTKYRRYK